MDDKSRRAWLAFIHAEQAYRAAMADLRDVDLERVLRESLQHLPWRRQALAVLQGSNIGLSVRLLPQLFELAAVSHSLLDEVRKCILRIPRDVLEREFPALVHGIILSPESDYEVFRRVAELLRLTDMPGLLETLVSAAAQSKDLDIQEVAEDFGGS
jgi:hypothetical protein